MYSIMHVFGNRVFPSSAGKPREVASVSSMCTITPGVMAHLGWTQCAKRAGDNGSQTTKVRASYVIIEYVFVQKSILHGTEQHKKTIPN